MHIYRYMCERGIFMGKRVVCVLGSIIFMYLFSMLALTGIAAVVYHQNLSGDVAEGGINLTYILTGLFGGCLCGRWSEPVLRIRVPILVSIGYCACLLMIAVILHEGRPGKGVLEYAIICGTMLLTTAIGYLLVQTRRRRKKNYIV